MQTAEWIALGAFGVSALALWASLAEMFSNKPKLRIVLSSASASPDYKGIKHSDSPRKLRPEEIGTNAIEMICVDITNFGRLPTMIKSIQFQMAGGKNRISPPPASPAQDIGTEIPAEVSPGHFRTFYFDAANLVQFQPATSPIPLKDFVFLKDVELVVRHSWQKRPLIIRGYQKT